jgi:hypothetical protein
MMNVKTLEEARKYRYGAWAGNPKGTAYKEGRCIKEVFPSGFPVPHQCNRKAVDGIYCAQHKKAE